MKHHEKLDTRREPKNKFTVAVIRESKGIVGHLMKKTGQFAKTSFFFLRVGQYHRCNVCVTSKAVNQGVNQFQGVSFGIQRFAATKAQEMLLSTSLI